MKSSQDRRSPAVSRVTHTALVDICSMEEDGSPFQGQSCNISGRGMHVRGSYLPEIGEQLVCRFNHDTQEVLVEGRVAWRSEGEDSGEFGIQFTALDADSADLLRNIGDGALRASSRSVPPVASDTLDGEEHDEDDAVVLESGERVRLHIDGLGAPMKANVMDGTHRKVRVGSTLEFLKMGRMVQLEALGDGERRGAQVDSVNVIINPTTSIPELVVQLRYEGVSPTPPPARVKSAKDSQATGLDFEDEAFHDDEDQEELAFAETEKEAWQPAAEVIRERLGGAMKSANQAAAQATSLISSFASKASASVVARVQSRSEKKQEGAKTKAKAAIGSDGVKRRVQSTARPSRHAPPHLRSGIHDLNMARGATRASSNRTADRKSMRPGSLSGTAHTTPPEAPLARRKWGSAVIATSAFVLFGGSALILRSTGDDAEVTQVAAAAETPVEAASERKPEKTASVSAAKETAEDDGEIVAEVPLFGTQAVASLSKAAPLDQKSDVEAEKRAAAAAVEDQSWEEATEVAEPQSAEPWGRGRLYLPTIHRIRLDQAGATLSGAVQADGFTVVIPGRKVMETGKSIQKRDKRIVAVKADNDGPNAKIRFEFRGPVPPYRVRLRQDFVEFLISAPEESVATL